MKEEMESKESDETGAHDNSRSAEAGDVAEPDAPTAEDENEGMNTVLGVEPVTGVQGSASEE